MYESEMFRSSPQASFPKLTVVFETRSCDMYLIHSYSPFPFSPFSDSCPSKIRAKTWGDKSYSEELQVILIKVRNKLLLFHYRKISITQNYERKTNPIQRAYILTRFSL